MLRKHHRYPGSQHGRGEQQHRYRDPKLAAIRATAEAYLSANPERLRNVFLPGMSLFATADKDALRVIPFAEYLQLVSGNTASKEDARASIITKLISEGVNTYPAWSPDGKKLAFRKMVGENNSEVFIAKMGSNRLSGKRICWSCYNLVSHLYRRKNGP